MTNREYITGLLSDQDFVDDGGSSYEAMVYYDINCPYFDGDERCLCNKKVDSRSTCFECKETWLDQEVDT